MPDSATLLKMLLVLAATLVAMLAPNTRQSKRVTAEEPVLDLAA